MNTASSPAYSIDGRVLALVIDGKVQLRFSSSGKTIGPAISPRWRWPASLPAPSGYLAHSVSWEIPECRQLLVKSFLTAAGGTSLLLSALRFG